MAELADAPDLGSGGATCRGSTPLSRTKRQCGGSAIKTFDLRAAAAISPEGEAVFGLEQTGSHACYMIYGILKPGEKERIVRPGKGHEELVLAATGDLHITGHFTGLLREGQAFHLAGESECRLENRSGSEARYVIAGGHSEMGHH